MLTRRHLLAAALASAVIPAARASDRTLRVVGATGLAGEDVTVSPYLVQNLEVGEGLFRVGPLGRIEPCLAIASETSADGLTWRFSLDPSARFHDGTKVSSEIVASSIGRARQIPASALYRAPIGSIAAEDDSVLVRLDRPFAILPAILAAASSIILAPSSYAAAGQVGIPVGTGPFKIDSLVDNNILELSSAKRQDSPASITRVRYLAVTDADTRARMVESRDAEIAYVVSPIAAERLARNSSLSVVRAPAPRLRYVMVNAADARLSDIRVRRALSLALDRAAAARAVLRNPGAAATGLMPPILPEWSSPGVATLDYNLAEAEALLQAAGWERQAEGPRRRGEQRLAFTLSTYAMRPELLPLATVMQAQWRKIGIDVTIETVMPERILQKSRHGSLQLGLMTRSYFAVPDPVATLSDDFLSTSSARGWGAVGWSSHELDDALLGYESTSSEAVRTAARRTITRILLDALPIIPHSWYEHVLAHTKQVTGVISDPFEASFRISRMQWA
ncbi:ABC transporter substrate-binding protein [Rhodopseudomonas sp. WA056]|uniref:ABC transporter substrate-binding protein n=1 Tax=Rhodopseudomonas sp. WA056 TaxID=2269367 RepID=UPI0013DFE462|nr:ABC transporter substrate-binding protein [Rhodopseudomonas sp. WA056]NEW87079.1 ABC transporter substrate-binding protein [Rhodopseudomonas sp. WA056]